MNELFLMWLMFGARAIPDVIDVLWASDPWCLMDE
jgi:hypothetical protein